MLRTIRKLYNSKRWEFTRDLASVMRLAAIPTMLLFLVVTCVLSERAETRMGMDHRMIVLVYNLSVMPGSVEPPPKSSPEGEGYICRFRLSLKRYKEIREHLPYCNMDIGALVIAVRAKNLDSKVVKVNFTVRFRKLRIACRRDIYPKDELNCLKEVFSSEKWRKEGRYVILELDSSTYSREFLVSTETNEVIDAETGLKLGEWIFWLSPLDLSRKYTLILAAREGLPPYFERNVSLNTASLALVNLSMTAPWSYKVGDEVIPAARTVMGFTFIEPLALGGLKIYGTNVNAIRAGVEVLSRKLAKWIRSGAFIPFMLRNGTFVLENRLLKQIYKEVEDFKPWKLKWRHVPSLCRGGVCERRTEIMVEYDGVNYSIAPATITLVYDKVTGLLLEYRCDKGPLGFPYLDVGCFGFALPAPFADYLPINSTAHLTLSHPSRPIKLILVNVKGVNLSVSTMTEENLNVYQRLLPYAMLSMFILAFVVYEAVRK